MVRSLPLLPQDQYPSHLHGPRRPPPAKRVRAWGAKLPVGFAPLSCRGDHLFEFAKSDIAHRNSCCLPMSASVWLKLTSSTDSTRKDAQKYCQTRISSADDVRRVMQILHTIANCRHAGHGDGFLQRLFGYPNMSDVMPAYQPRDSSKFALRTEASSPV